MSQIGVDYCKRKSANWTWNWCYQNEVSELEFNQMTNGDVSSGAEAESKHYNEEGSWIKEEPRTTSEKHERLVVHPFH